MIHVLIGTKAQLIKMAPIMKSLLKLGVSYNFIHSGQHQETMADILQDFCLPDPDAYIVNGPDIKSKIQVPRWLYLCEKRTRPASDIWAKRPKGSKDIVLVHGDTLSTLVGALAAKRMGFMCGHVESGLRSFNIFHPFPEEIVRLAMFRLADILYCPDETSKNNVSSYRKRTVVTNGNTMLDSTRLAVQTKNGLEHENYGIVSIHRYENIFRTSRLQWIVKKIMEVANEHRITFILHAPTEQRLRNTGLYERLSAEPRITLSKRLSYFDFVSLLGRASFLITDGGSNQEESSYIGLPCLVMRKSTERDEGIGQNVVLSNYSDEAIHNFFVNLDSLRTPVARSSHSPTDIIVRDLEPYY